MNEAEAFRELLPLFVETLKDHTEYLEKLNARLLVLRTAIASFHEHPADAEESLRKLEEYAEAAALAASKFQQSDAMMRLIKAGKKLDEPDA